MRDGLYDSMVFVWVELCVEGGNQIVLKGCTKMAWSSL
jgi:hypothetical protein